MASCQIYHLKNSTWNKRIYLVWKQTFGQMRFVALPIKTARFWLRPSLAATWISPWWCRLPSASFPYGPTLQIQGKSSLGAFPCTFRLSALPCLFQHSQLPSRHISTQSSPSGTSPVRIKHPSSADPAGIRIKRCPTGTFRSPSCPHTQHSSLTQTQVDLTSPLHFCTPIKNERWQILSTAGTASAFPFCNLPFRAFPK